MKIANIYISSGHNFYGRQGKDPLKHTTESLQQVECIEGSGLVGDRFFDYKDDYRGQITFFSFEVYNNLCSALEIHDKDTGVFRRNVITSGVDLNTLIDQEFEIQGIQFLGTVECSPCAWMDQAFGPGAEAFLKGQGGLRAKILTSGTLKVDAA